MLKEEHRAWAIDTRSKKGHGLIGQHWWFEVPAPIIPIHMQGTRTALFETRQKARDNLLCVKAIFPKAQVVPVNVYIIVQP